MNDYAIILLASSQYIWQAPLSFEKLKEGLGTRLPLVKMINFIDSHYYHINCSYLSASFPSPPNATTVLIPESTSSAMPPAEAYALCSRTVNDAMIYKREHTFNFKEGKIVDLHGGLAT